MASIHKTWAFGEILTSSDVNSALNPTTADHIPYAVAAGITNCTTPAPVGWSTITSVVFPTSRFSQPPIVMTTFKGTGFNEKYLTVYASNITATGFDIYVNAVAASVGANANVAWTAIQMVK